MSGPASNRTQYHNPYANLAAAILDSGKRCNDTAFLESDWADILRAICSIDDEMYVNRSIEIVRPKVHKSLSYIENDYEQSI